MEFIKPVYLTQTGFEKLNDELEYLRVVRRVEIAEALHDAQSGGDSEDNTEYLSIQYEQLLLEMRLSELRRLLSAAQLIVPGNGDGMARLGSTVTIEDEEEMQQESYLIVGSAEADPGTGRISNECPLGRAVLDRRAGECVEVPTPDGLIRYRILAVT
jgi:transcription elongation factor GreA